MAVKIPSATPHPNPPPQGGRELVLGKYGGYAYFGGEIIPFQEATVSVGTHALNYGTACFEGIRGYWNVEHEDIYLLKLAEHYQRFKKSTALLKIRFDETVDQLCDLTREVIRRSGYQTDVYVRPLAFKASPIIKVDLHSAEDALAILVMPMGPYSRTDGLRVTISSWRRISDNSIPARAKITGAYINTALATEDANAAGYDDCLLLTEDGHIAEGSAANFCDRAQHRPDGGLPGRRGFPLRNRRPDRTDHRGRWAAGRLRKTWRDCVRAAGRLLPRGPRQRSALSAVVHAGVRQDAPNYRVALTSAVRGC